MNKFGDTFMSRKDVCATTTLGKTTLWELIREGKFPKPVTITEGGKQAFFRSDVEAWIEGKRKQTVAQ